MGYRPKVTEAQATALNRPASWHTFDLVLSLLRLTLEHGLFSPFVRRVNRQSRILPGHSMSDSLATGVATLSLPLRNSLHHAHLAITRPFVSRYFRRRLRRARTHSDLRPATGTIADPGRIDAISPPTTRNLPPGPSPTTRERPATQPPSHAAAHAAEPPAEQPPPHAPPSTVEQPAKQPRPHAHSHPAEQPAKQPQQHANIHDPHRSSPTVKHGNVPIDGWRRAQRLLSSSPRTELPDRVILHGHAFDAQGNVERLKSNKLPPGTLHKVASRTLRLIIDSGATWHLHADARDLVNLRPCQDTVTIANANELTCSHIGDLPFTCRDRAGNLKRVLLSNTRLPWESRSLYFR